MTLSDNDKQVALTATRHVLGLMADMVEARLHEDEPTVQAIHKSMTQAEHDLGTHVSVGVIVSLLMTFGELQNVHPRKLVNSIRGIAAGLTIDDLG